MKIDTDKINNRDGNRRRTFNAIKLDLDVASHRVKQRKSSVYQDCVRCFRENTWSKHRKSLENHLGIDAFLLENMTSRDFKFKNDRR